MNDLEEPVTAIGFSRSLLQRLQEGDEIADLIGVEAKLWHGRVASDDALGESFLQLLDRISLVQCAERRSYLQGTGADLVSRVTPRAI